MRSLLLYSIAVAIFTILINIFLYIFIHQKHLKNFFESPIPDFLTLSSNSQVKLLDFWLPIIEKTEGSENGVPDFTAKSVLIYDLTTNKTIFEHKAFERMPMASLTKIMTAIVALENKRSDDHYTVHKEDLVGEDSMGLEEGEILHLEELLYGLMLQSGNDAAEVIARNYPGGRTAFISAMNNKAKALGLENTVFSNPSGLQGDGVQYTTAYDLLVMTKYMLDNFPIMRKIVATYEYVIPKTTTHKEYHLFNETNLLTTYPGVQGVKTGFTPEAGMCLISYLEYGDHKIIGILLNSKNRREEMKNFLDFSLKRLGITPPTHQ
jgi:D-alanyl-D-alanine carboxypeptidase